MGDSGNRLAKHLTPLRWRPDPPTGVRLRTRSWQGCRNAALCASARSGHAGSRRWTRQTASVAVSARSGVGPPRGREGFFRCGERARPGTLTHRPTHPHTVLATGITDSLQCTSMLIEDRVIDERVMGMLGHAIVEDTWFGAFPLPSEVEQIKRVLIGDVLYLPLPPAAAASMAALGNERLPQPPRSRIGPGTSMICMACHK